MASRLQSLLDPADLAWLRSMIQRQASQPWQQIKCGPLMEPVSVYLKRFRGEWTAALRSIATACRGAADQCSRLLQLDPLRPDSDAEISSSIARIWQLTDPLTIRTAARQRERCSFGEELRRLRLERGLSLRGLANACEQAAQRLRFRSHSPLPYQIVALRLGGWAPTIGRSL